MEKEKPNSTRIEPSKSPHICTCQRGNICNCSCHHHFSPHHSPNHSLIINLSKDTVPIMNPTIDSRLNHLSFDKDTEYEYSHKMRRDHSAANLIYNSGNTTNANSNIRQPSSNATTNPSNVKLPGSQSMGSLIKQNENNKILQLDLETFNSELLALKKKLALGKKDIQKSQLHRNDKFPNANLTTPILPRPNKNNHRHNNGLFSNGNNKNNTDQYHSNTNTNTNSSHRKLYKESFFITIYSEYDRRNDNEENDYDDNNNYNREKERERQENESHKNLIIEELNMKLYELHKIIDMNKAIDAEKDSKLKQQSNDIDKLKKDLTQSKEVINNLKKKLSSQQPIPSSSSTSTTPITSTSTKRSCFDIKTIKPSKGDYLTYAGVIVIDSNNKKSSLSKGRGKLQETTDETEKTETTIYRIGGDYDNKIINRIRFDNQKIIQTKISKYSMTSRDKLSNNLIYKVYDNKSLLYFDIESRKFHLYHFADYADFNDNYLKDSSIYLTVNNIMYIITGNNCDLMYSYNSKGNKMNKQCSLLNNHTKGTLISYKPIKGVMSILCIGSSYNKKVERYSIAKNSWSELPELNVERSECACAMINNHLLYAIFGYNTLLNQFNESIEYLDMNNENAIQWETVSLENPKAFLCDIKGCLAINYNDKKIILVGGMKSEDNTPIDSFYQLLFNSGNENEVVIEKVDRKLNDVNKNKCYTFSSGFRSYEDDKKRNYNIAFDDKGCLHMFEVNKMMHDVFYFE